MKHAGRAYTLLLRPESFCIHRLAPDAALDLNCLRGAAWYSVTRSEEELSVVAPREIALQSSKREDGWSCLRIAGTLDFALVGVIAEIASILAGAGISLFALSTYDTDYLLLKTADIKTAVSALTDAGHEVLAG